MNTQSDIDRSTNKEVFPHHIRLIDEMAVQEHSGADGDLYVYYKMQADKGELFALVCDPRSLLFYICCSEERRWAGGGGGRGESGELEGVLGRL